MHRLNGLLQHQCALCIKHGRFTIHIYILDKKCALYKHSSKLQLSLNVLYCDENITEKLTKFISLYMKNHMKSNYHHSVQKQRHHQIGTKLDFCNLNSFVLIHSIPYVRHTYIQCAHVYTYTLHISMPFSIQVIRTFNSCCDTLGTQSSDTIYIDSIIFSIKILVSCYTTGLLLCIVPQNFLCNVLRSSKLRQFHKHINIIKTFALGLSIYERPQEKT